MTRNSKPPKESLVTVIIPTHNRRELLERAVESVRSQSYRNLEIIVADDASSDGTAGAVHEWCREDPRIRYMHSEENIGAAAIRNRAAELSNGQFICFLDDDDEWFPYKVSEQLAAISSYPLIGATLKRADAYTIGGRLRLRKLGERRDVKKKLSEDLTELTIEDVFFDNGRISPSSMMVYTEKFLGVGGFDESLVASQGRDLLVRIVLKYGNIARINTPLSKQYQQHGLVRISTTRNHLVGGWKEFNKNYSYMPRHLQNWRQFILCLREAKFSESVNLRIRWLGRSLVYVRPRYLMKHIRLVITTQFLG